MRATEHGSASSVVERAPRDLGSVGSNLGPGALFGVLSDFRRRKSVAPRYMAPNAITHKEWIMKIPACSPDLPGTRRGEEGKETPTSRIQGLSLLSPSMTRDPFTARRSGIASKLRELCASAGMHRRRGMERIKLSKKHSKRSTAEYDGSRDVIRRVLRCGDVRWSRLRRKVY